MSETTLYSYHNTSVTLAEACQFWNTELAGAATLYYSSEKCEILTFDELTRSTFTGAAPFEVRIFTSSPQKDSSSQGELRWLADAESFDASKPTKNLGSVVYLTEKVRTGDLKTWEKSEDACVGTRDDCYALWGEYERDKDNAYVFFEHRVGELSIPKVLLPEKTPESGRKAGLTVKEYIAVTDKHGNCSVIAERLCSLDWFPKKPDQT